MTSTPAAPLKIDNDNAVEFKPAQADEYVPREEMVPKRNCTKVFTVLMIHKGASQASMVLDRTPYAVGKVTRVAPRPRADMVLQNVRGNHNQPADYVKATQRALRAHAVTSFVDLPVVPAQLP